MNKKTIINEAISELEQNRFQEEIVAEQNYKFARKKSSEFSKQDNLLREKTLEYAMTEENSEKAKALKKEIENIKKERLFALEKIKISEQDFLPNYSCKKCLDTGYVGNKMCSCLKKKIHKKLKEFCGIKNRDLHTFSDNNPEVFKDNETLEKAHNLAKIYVEKFPNVKTPNLVFMGKVGVGKTFLLECMASALIEKQIFVVYTTIFELFNSMLKSMTISIPEKETIQSTFLDCDLLIIDDLGSEVSYKNLSISILFTILNERERKNKPTLFSTNLDFEQIEQQYGNRIFSRLFNKRKAKVIGLKGRDLRIN